MLKLIFDRKNLHKTKFYKSETKTNLKLIYFSVLILLLVLSNLYIFGKSNKNYLINQFKPSNLKIPSSNYTFH